MLDDRRAALAAARLYLVCDAISDERLDGALRGGVQLVQLRMKTGDEDAIVAAAHRLGEVCRRRGVPLILNDRPDLVEAAGADGAHVGQDDLDPATARRYLGPDRLLGLSTHTPHQIEAAADQPVDYIGVGPVHATPTKPGRPAVGATLVRHAARHAAMPFFAIGGIDSRHVGPLCAAGASRIAVVRALTTATDPERAARELRSAVEAEVGVGAA